ncbi:MAG: DUF6278 family protein [Paenirhodobacter sp.]|uniref:DUF6278 family protein n=1 Tax=Paenirhodobacter sp. TaxID=1965326 RepID=UPI003D127810
MSLSPETAAEAAASFVATVARTQGVTLDYSVESLAFVDRLLGQFHDGGDRAQAMPKTVASASCYLGEVIRRHAGGVWIRPEESDAPEVMRFPLMMRIGSASIVPFFKVAKRIDNGPEDDLVFYYAVVTKTASPAAQPPAPEPAQRRPGLFARLFGRRG